MPRFSTLNTPSILHCKGCNKDTPHAIGGDFIFCIPCNNKRKPQHPPIASGPIILTAPKQPKTTKQRHTKDNPGTPATAVWEELRKSHRERERKARTVAAQKIAQNRPEVKARNAAAQKIAQNRPDVKARQAAIQKIVQNRPEVKARQAAAQKIAQNRPDVKARQAAIQKIVQNRPEVKARMKAAQKRAREDRAAAAYIRGMKPQN